MIQHERIIDPRSLQADHNPPLCVHGPSSAQSRRGWIVIQHERIIDPRSLQVDHNPPVSGFTVNPQNCGDTTKLLTKCLPLLWDRPRPLCKQDLTTGINLFQS